MATAAVGAVGLALSAGSQISQISAVRKQAAQQEQATVEQMASAQQRMQLAYQNSAQRRANAEMAQQREREVILTQQKQAQTQLAESKLNERLAKIQSTLQSQGVKTEAERTIAKLLLDSSNEANQLQTANSDEIGALNQQQSQVAAQQGAERVATAGKTGSAMSLSGATQEAALANQLAGAEQATNENVGTRDAQAHNSQQYAQGLSANVLNQANSAAGYIDTSQANQDASNALGFASGKKQIGLQTKRNLTASKAAYSSAASAENGNYLSQVMNERANMVGLESQRSQIQRPSFLSYATVAANTAVGAYQNGLLSFSSSRAAQPAQQSVNRDALTYFNSPWRQNMNSAVNYFGQTSYSGFLNSSNNIG